MLYTLLFLLLGSSVYLIGYLTGGGNGQNSLSTFGAATLSRFTKPQETKAPQNLLDKLPSEKVSYPKLSLDGRSVTYYDAISGYLHKIELSETGNKNITLQKIKPYLQNLNWSWDRKLLLASDGADNIVYDFALNSNKILSRSIKNPVFSSSEDKASYVWQDLEKNTANVSISDTAFESYKNLLPARADDWQPSWVDSHTLALVYLGGQTSSLFTLDTETKNLTRLLVNKDDLETRWSLGGTSLLYSHSLNGKTMLYYRSLASGQETQLPRPGLGSQCAWSIDEATVYCATGDDSSDEFFVWKSGDREAKTLKIETAVKIKAESLFLSADERYLFFKNSFDGALYRLKIETIQ